MRNLFFLPIVWLVVVTHKPSAAATDLGRVRKEASVAAENLLQSLSAKEREEAQHAFPAGARTEMSYFPGKRAGLPLRAMNPVQEKLARTLLRSALSESGLLKAQTIMTLDQVLREMGRSYDAKNYYFAVFGEPGRLPWAWRVEGHHLSVNLTFTEKGIAETPSFFGANPATTQADGQVKHRPLEPEEELARQLVKSFDAERQKRAIIATRSPREIITGTKPRVVPERPAGLSHGEMNSGQQHLLVRLIQEYIDRYRAELAADDWAAIKEAGLDQLHFAWAGGLEPGQGHYYRIQSPTFLMEYDNTQNNANHIHTVWRSFEGDYGRDALREHYAETPHE